MSPSVAEDQDPPARALSGVVSADDRALARAGTGLSVTGVVLDPQLGQDSPDRSISGLSSSLVFSSGPEAVVVTVLPLNPKP